MVKSRLVKEAKGVSPFGRWLFAIIFGSILIASIYLRLEALAIAALAALGFAWLRPEMLESLAGRLRKAGPFEFEADAAVRKALEAVPANARPKAEKEARETIERLRNATITWWRFANVVRAELAALGIRITALEEELASVRAHLIRPPGPPGDR